MKNRLISKEATKFQASHFLSSLRKNFLTSAFISFFSFLFLHFPLQATCTKETVNLLKDAVTISILQKTRFIFSEESELEMRGQRYHATVKKVDIIFDGNIMPLENLTRPLRKKKKKLILIIETSPQEKLILPLPQKIEENFLKLLHSNLLTSSYKIFDCQDFVCYLHAVPNPKTSEEAQERMGTKYWNSFKFSEKKLKTGDVIALIETTYDSPHFSFQEFAIHYALYLSSGLYLSKYGVSGPLAVSHLEEMLNAYPADKILLLKAKTK